MLNGIFFFVVLVSILLAAFFGRMPELTQAVLMQAKTAVELAIGLIGAMVFFLGLMKVAEDGGMLRIIARLVAPLMRRLFPDVPPDHPAVSAMILNIASNMMGLTNAATPFGIRAMEQLDKLNGQKGTATNAMVLFLAINTAGLAILPSGVVSLRTSLGSQDPAGIFVTTWFASGCATIVGVLAAITLSRMPWIRRTRPPVLAADAEGEAGPQGELLDDAAVTERLGKRPFGAPLVSFAFGATFIGLLVWRVVSLSGTLPLLDILKEIFSFWFLPALIAGILLFGWSRGVKVYESLVEGGKEGWNVAKRIIPFLVAILVMIGMLRASGGIDLIVAGLGPLTSVIAMPAEALPMALLRPLSGSGAYGVMAEIMKQHGPDSYIGYLVSTFQGSTETTFYVLAVYFGAVGVRRTRHALPACLLADTAGILAALFIVHLLFG